jgi:hypothetical protein
VSVAEMQDYLNLPSGQDAGLLQSFILAATDAMSRHLRATLQTQTLRLIKDGFAIDQDDALLRLGPGTHTGSYIALTGGGDAIDLPRGPVQSVTQIVTFDRANVSSVFDAAAYVVNGPGARVFLNEGYTWPVNLRPYAAIQVDYVAGYATLPAAIAQGIREHVAAMYECRGACEMPRTVTPIVQSYRRHDELGWR